MDSQRKIGGRILEILLRTLAQDHSLPWCIIGDFSDLLSNDDKRGHVDQSHQLISGFKSAIWNANLIDIPMDGYPFTWSKNKGSNHEVEESLDMTLARQYWLTIFTHCCSLINVLPSEIIVIRFGLDRLDRSIGLRTKHPTDLCHLLDWLYM